MIYPFRCKPIYKEKVWGGRWLEKEFCRQLPENKLIGESWELSCRSDEVSEIMDGQFAGKSFAEVMKLFPEDLLGKEVLKRGIDPFPLLIKFLDANDRLSVQVHPDDGYMSKVSPGESGKTEMWYVLDAKPGAKLIIGVKKGVTLQEFKKGVEEGNLDEYLNAVEVKKGDAFFIPAGTVHAILEGVKIAEIQQNSDTTYRIYDWNRIGLDGKPRELHTKEALEVMDFTKNDGISIEGLKIIKEGYNKRILTVCPYFVVEELEVNKLKAIIEPDRFEVWMVIGGSGCLRVSDCKFKLSVGETWFIPACIGEYEIEGELRILKSYVPGNLISFTDNLLNEGFDQTDLKKIAGLEI